MCQRRLARCLASAALVAALLIGACSTPRPGPASAPTEGEAAVEGRAVFVREQGVVVLERGARRVLFPLPRGANAKDPVWSPDGASVAFAYAPPRPGSTPATVPELPTQAFASDLMAVRGDGRGSAGERQRRPRRRRLARVAAAEQRRACAAPVRPRPDQVGTRPIPARPGG